MHIFSILILEEYKKRDTAEAKFRIASAYKWKCEPLNSYFNPLNFVFDRSAKN